MGQVAQGTRFHDALADSGGHGLSGMLDEVRIYNRVLDSTEIETLAGQNLVMETWSSGMLAGQIASLPGDTCPAITAAERSLDAVEAVMEESLKLWSACEDGAAIEQTIADLEAGIRNLTCGSPNLSSNDEHFMGDYVTGSNWLREATPVTISDPLDSAEDLWAAVDENIADDRLDLLTLLARELCSD